MYLQIISYIFIFSALLVAILNNNNLKNTSEKYFVYYLSFVFTIEMLQIILHNYYKLNTSFIYNLYDIVTFSFFIYWYYKVLDSKKLVKMAAVIYLIALISSLFINDFFSENLNSSIYIGALLILILTIIYFSELLNKDEIINFSQNSKFWISLGLVVFYIGYLPILFLLSSKYAKQVNIDFMITILCVLTYSFFIKGFLCSQTTKK